MSYSTILVHLGIKETNTERLAVARDLAESFGSLVIGTAACDPEAPASYDGIYLADAIEADRRYAADRLTAAEAEFRQGFSGAKNEIEWRSAASPPGMHVARLCRAADLVITGAVEPEFLADPNWRLDAGDLVMRAGRPVLLVPRAAMGSLPARKVVVGWKDSREARRAVHDALPLARLAERVLVASIAEESDEAEVRAGVSDVVAWFRRHGVGAEARSEPRISEPADQLRVLAEDEDADLIVAGGYGHSRMREWVLGGVTRDFLTRGGARYLLMSH